MTGLTKVRRDLAANRGLVAMMVVAMAAAMVGFGTIAGTYSILAREMPASYLDTVPASATFNLAGGVDAELLREVRSRSEVNLATRRLSVLGRYGLASGDGLGAAKIFVVDDFAPMAMAKITWERGAWPPPLGTVVLERSALRLLNRDVGDTFLLRAPGGSLRRVSVSGIGHDPSLAPAISEQAIYVFMTAETYAWLAETPVFDELRVVFAADQGVDWVAIEDAAQGLARWLGAQGHAVDAIRIPPPGAHPHQSQLSTILAMLGIFGLLMVAQGGVLVAALVGTMMARQVREIGIIKAIGARRRQVFSLYLVMLCGLALAAFALSVVPAVLSARGFSLAVGAMLNFDLQSLAISPWVLSLEAAVAVAVPVLMALPTLRRGAAMSVQQALSHTDAAVPAADKSGAAKLMARLGWHNRLATFAVENALRNRRRFFMGTALLAMSGGLFVATLSLTEAWQHLARSVFAANHYDVELIVAGNHDEARVVAALRQMPEVSHVEVWHRLPVAFATPGRVDVERTYPDEGHGSFSLASSPLDSTLVDRVVVAGRWLTADDDHAVVLNQSVPDHDARSVGKEISLSVHGRAHRFVVVGVLRELGPAVAYVPQATFAALADPARPLHLKVALDRALAGGLAQTTSALERRLEDMGFAVLQNVPVALVSTAIAEHFAVLVDALLFLAVLLAWVGTLGLGASTSASIIERRREFAVLRAIGARAAQIRRVVLAETLVTGVASGVLAIALAVPLAMTIGETIGTMSFGVPLPLRLSMPAVVGWLVAAPLLAAVAALAAARRAGKLTVQEALR